ncbi:MAG: cation:proton antiporter [Flavobacteriales bacterium]
MGSFSVFSLLIVIAALFAYVNFRFLKLPASIGLMFIALLFSVLLVAVGKVEPHLVGDVRTLVERLDLSRLLMNNMLGFLLFAGAVNIKIDALRQEKWAVMALSTVGVVTSTLLVGSLMFVLLPLFGIEMQFLHCLLFGALISPTDPIAVLGILKDAKVPPSLEMKIAGESLFNDGVAVVVFLTILEVAESPGSFGTMDVVRLFAQEALGGIAFGLAVGWVAFLLMRSIDNYKVEVLITLAVVMGGYSLARVLHVSGPLAMVVAGILIGNHGKKHAMSKTTEEYVDKFWELIDEILNAVLFVLIGLELLVVKLDPVHFAVGGIAIVLILGVRYVSVWVPAQLIRFNERMGHKTLLMLTWGGLRGGISIAMAISLGTTFDRGFWITLTYIVVTFSILVQGLTIGKLARRLAKG